MCPPASNGAENSKAGSLWPILIAGAAAGAVWSGLDTDLTRASAIELARLPMAFTHQWFYSACF
jgi:hypothetical protein